MSDKQDPPAKRTLTLKRKPNAGAAGSEDGKRDGAQRNGTQRVRSGARARQVAHLNLEREKTERTEASAKPRRDRPAPDANQDAPRRDRDRDARPRTASRDGAGRSADAPQRRPRDPDGAPAVEIRERPRHRGPRSQPLLETSPAFASCPQGLEQALAVELQALGFDDAVEGRAGAHFSADWTGIMRANLYSRLATRILVQVAQAPVAHEDDILELAYRTPWERWFGAEHRLRVDTSAIRSPMQSLQYCNLRAKDGICDRLRDREGARPDIDTVRPDARVHLFLSSDTATLYLDTSGESLFKRGWRLDKGVAPLRENLAAGLLALAGWDPEAPLLDPFCGSGTLLIEAAWIALGVPPGISRPFGFERLRGHDPRRWRDLKADARAHVRTQLDTPLIGVDIDPRAIEAAQGNAERAWLSPDTIRFETGDARHLTAPAPSGWIVTNPPYGERLEAGDDDLWQDWAACLKRQFGGWQLAAISSDHTLPQRMRLKPRLRTPIYNGALDCRLFQFELVSAGYRN